MTTATVSPRPGADERLARLIRIPTVSAELEQRGLAPFDELVDLLSELYPLVHEHLERERITDLGLLYRWRGRSDEAPVVLMAHYDVVPVDESDDWTYPPFEGRVADGWVHGRGALDDKGPLVVVLEAVENLLAAGFTPARDVYLSFGGNEESHGAAAAAIAATLHERGVIPWLVLDEGGAVTDSPLPLVPGSAAMIGVGEKGVLTLRLTARGEGGHASAPPTTTAVRRVARAVERLGPRTFPARTPVAISRMLRLFSDRATGPARTALRALAAAPPVSAQTFAAMGGEAAAIVRTTVAPTMLSGGTAANVLPSQASATVNLRIALGETVAGTVERVRRRVDDPQVEIEVVEGSEPSPESPVDDERFALLAACVGVSHPDALPAPYITMQATDARHFHRFAPAVYRFAPLAMSAELRATIHGVDERVEVAELERGERFHRALLERLP
ncbi:M20/M25/M40 family metallo-hydrolase [Cellulosimicrobium protaetiae]|uniref:M20/M25/M40 family metallo-hydrolase n=1 Tax=Cellulosimicrobium protaetiae TaxID=2587808 RepID=A0A6M5UIW3_9MICO|nr:M20/M25/M40 family metallo-hydrolase [Cellulosimicrobium protaetiae]QJW37482.1 M20/M25/M40 family metallo-hydrolase [Cellulosimicrobium protaetiae]